MLESALSVEESIRRSAHAHQHLVDFQGAGNLNQGDDRRHHLATFGARQVGPVNSCERSESSLCDISAGSQPANQSAYLFPNLVGVQWREVLLRSWKVDFNIRDVEWTTASATFPRSSFVLPKVTMLTD